MPYDPNNPKDKPYFTDEQRARYAANPTPSWGAAAQNSWQNKILGAANAIPRVEEKFWTGAGNPAQTLFEKDNGWTNFIDNISPVQPFARGIANLWGGHYKNAAGSFGGAIAGSAGLMLPGIWKPLAAQTGISTVMGTLGLGEKKPQTASSVLPGRTPASSPQMTPEQYTAMVAANRNRTDAAGNTGMGGRMTVEGTPAYKDWYDLFVSKGVPAAEAAKYAHDHASGQITMSDADRASLDKSRTTTKTGTTATGTGMGLLPLTPEQLSQIGEERSAAEKAYEDLINQYKLQEEQGRQGYVSDVQAARRQAAGAAVDVGSGLMDTGLGDSPAAAFGAGQMVEGPRQAREMADIKTLNQLLSQLAMGRTQAKSEKEANMVAINRMLNNYRIQNTLASQMAAYNNLGGL